MRRIPLRHVLGAAVALVVLVLPQTAAGVTQPPRFIGTWGSPGSGAGEFDDPEDVAVNPVSGFVYVVDSANHRVETFTGDGTFVDEWGDPGVLDGEFAFPQGIAVNPVSGDVYVADTANSRVQRFDADGNHLATYPDLLIPMPIPAVIPPDIEENTDGFVVPSDVAVNPLDGSVYVADSGNNRIMRLSADLEYETHWGAPGGLPGDGDGEFVFPTGVAVDPATGYVYVTDSGNSRVQKFGPNGNFHGEWGSLGSGGGDFTFPNGPSVGPGSTVFVADSGNDRIEEFTGTGGFLTEWGSSGSETGEFHDPTGTAATPTAHVYVADSGNDRIQRFGPAPAVLVVDDDGYAARGNCNAPYPSFAFSRIQYAVDFAAPGDTILVCPGLYPEHVAVDKRLTITGPGQAPTARACNTPTASAPETQAVVRGSLASGDPTVLLDADSIRWEGFVVETAVAGPGIVTTPTHSGVTIRRNTVQQNRAGILLESAGGGVVQSNCIRQNGAAGAGSGYGIRSTAVLRSTRVESNLFFGNPVAAFSAVGATQGLSLSSNKSRGDGAFAELYGASSSRVNANIVQKGGGSGVSASASPGLQIRGNIVEDGGGDGIVLAAPASASPVVSGNIVQRMGREGILLAAGAATGASLQGNISNLNGRNGILLEAGASTRGSLKGNIAQSNRRDGIRIESGNSGNTVTGNIGRSNAPHDCHDSSTGRGTAGTANTWDFLHTICGTQNRNGLSYFAVTTAPVHPASH